MRDDDTERYIVLRARLLDDFSLGEWAEVSRCQTEAEALKMAASMRTNDCALRVLRADDLAVLADEPPIESAY